LTSRHFLSWCEERKIQLIHIQPGRPMQNGHVESFNRTLRDEALNANWFRNLLDARAKISAWREEYNGERPHSSLGYRTPNEFAGMLKSSVMTGRENRGESGQIRASGVIRVDGRWPQAKCGECTIVVLQETVQLLRVVVA